MADGTVTGSFHKGDNYHEQGGGVDKEPKSYYTDAGNLVTELFPPWKPTFFEVGTVKFAAFGDRYLVVEDEFRSGYECQSCNGSGRVACMYCDGKGEYERDGRSFKCSSCSGGKLTCPQCGGKGGLLVIPDISKRRPTTGQVVSCGEKTKYFKFGDNVMFSNFAGHAIDLERAGLPIVLHILHESEILAQVEGHLELRSAKNQREALGV
jgi:co-chaperonin GroES (HSP10)